MTEERRTVTRSEQVVAPATASYTETTYRSSGNSTLQRLIIFIFAIIQGLLLLRIVLLLVAARQGNDLVRTIYDVSEVLVAPFRGILSAKVVPAGSTALDVTAVVALIGYTIVELVILGLVRVFRRTA